MFVSVILFILFILIFTLLPSKIILTGILKIRSPDIIIDISLNTIFGTSILILLMAFLEYFNLPLFLILTIPVFVLFNFRNPKKLFKSDLISASSILIFMLLLVFALIQAYPLYYGGRLDSLGLHFPSLHDNLWNLAIINELIKKFPPDNPAISGVVLKNHHYFYLYFLTLIHKVTSIGIYDLYFRIGPVFVSFLFGSGLYLVSSIFTSNLFFRILAVFMGIFTGNFAYIAPVFLKNIRSWQGNLFFADQPFDQIFNPYTIMGYAVFLTSIYSFYRYMEVKRFSAGWLIITSVSVAVIYGIKSFGGIILIMALFLLSFISFFLFGNKRVFILFITVGLFFTPVFLLISNPGTVSMVFIPGWLLTEMMTGKDKLNLPQFADKENYYKAINNYPGIIKLKSVELIIYLLGNLGVRILGIVYLALSLLKNLSKKTDFLTVIYCLIIIFISLSIPLLFNLSSSPYNIIQFTPFALILLAIFTALFLEQISRIFNNLFFTGLIIVLIVILAIPVNVKNILSKINDTKGDIITHQELEVLNYLSQTKENNVILINPDQYSNSPIYIPALSNKPVFLADRSFAVQTGVDAKSREEQIAEFFKNNMTDISFLRRNKIAYIYLHKDNNYLNRVTKNAEYTANYRIIRENESVVLLGVKQ